ncbi:unnamed protein product, partial [Nesidiocoris tenuis]
MRCHGDGGAHKNTEHESGYFEDDDDEIRRDGVVDDEIDHENNNDLVYGLCGNANGEELFYSDDEPPDKGSRFSERSIVDSFGTKISKSRFWDLCPLCFK